MSFFKDGPPSFPQAPGAHSGYPPPQGPPPQGPPPQHSGYNPGYTPSYGPPGGQGQPPAPQGFGFPSPSAGFPSPSGFPSPGYPPPPGPPSGYLPPPGPPPSLGPPSPGYNPPSGPPPGPPSSGYKPPPGPPPSGYKPPAGPPPGFPGSSPQPPAGGRTGGYPGQQWHQQQNNNGGRPGQQYQQQNSGYGAPHANQYHPNGPPPRPPATIQNYGPHIQGPDHKDAQPYFQYSQCTGKRKALCIGINYFGQRGELKGCINDARNIQGFLCKRFGYKPDDIVMLTDDSQNPRMRPTRENIIQAMRWLVKGASPNDSLFFHYSGHGGQTKDLDGDEGDGYDEVIYPVDYEKNSHIVDDMMHDIMVKPLPAGCRLTAIFDSCHSGSALDLPYIYSTEGKVKEPNLAAEAGQGLLSAVTSYAKGDMSGVFKSAMGLVKVAAGNTAKADKYAKKTRTSPADVISWSGCKDSQTSADTSEAGQATGAMSFAFISALGSNSQQSYQELLNNIRDILRSKYSQKPQLSSSHPMDTNIMFIC